MEKKKLRLAIEEWGCFGYYGYGQGKAAATFGDDLGKTTVCETVCSRSAACRAKQIKLMDEQFPSIADIVKKTIAGVAGTDIQLVPMVMSAMNVAVKRNNVEALRIKEGLKAFGVDTMTDHYIYGQMRNLDNGLNNRPPDSKPNLILFGADLK